MRYFPRGIFRNPQITPLIIVSVISIVLIVMPLNTRTTISRVGTLSLLYPFGQLNKYLARIDTTFRVNRELNRKLDSMTVLVSNLIENKYENERLRKMLDYEPHVPLKLIPAEAVAISFGYPYRSMTINIGTDKGITANMPVISPDGVIGKTVAAGWHSSTVQLLFDPACRVAAKIQASRAQGILVYTGGNYLTLRDVPMEESVLPGDSVITSGLGGIFPEGLFIGTVISSGEQTSALFRNIRVYPGANFSGLDEVFVVTSANSN